MSSSTRLSSTRYIQVALLSQRGHAMLPVCLVQYLEYSLLSLVTSASYIHINSVLLSSAYVDASYRKHFAFRLPANNTRFCLPATSVTNWPWSGMGMLKSLFLENLIIICLKSIFFDYRLL